MEYALASMPAAFHFALSASATSPSGLTFPPLSPSRTMLCLPVVRYGPFSSMPPVRISAVVLPALTRSRTSSIVRSSVQSVSRISIGRGISATSTRGCVLTDATGRGGCDGDAGGWASTADANPSVITRSAGTRVSSMAHHRANRPPSGAPLGGVEDVEIEAQRRDQQDHRCHQEPVRPVGQEPQAMRRFYCEHGTPSGLTEPTFSVLTSRSLFVSTAGVPLVPFAGFSATVPPLLAISCSARRVPETSTV